jgi:hypothetical protein
LKAVRPELVEGPSFLLPKKQVQGFDDDRKRTLPYMMLVFVISPNGI